MNGHILFISFSSQLAPLFNTLKPSGYYTHRRVKR
jgi:hypothetical protein